MATVPNEVAAAVSIQASLKKVGINVNIQKYPSGKYFSDNAGAPAFVHSHNLGLMMMAWGADWPTGYGFLDQIIDGKAIKASGNTNLSELNDPKVNTMLDSAIQNTDDAARDPGVGRDRQAGHDRRRDRAAGLPPGPALPPAVGDQRDGHPGVRHVRLPATSARPSSIRARHR